MPAHHAPQVDQQQQQAPRDFAREYDLIWDRRIAALEKLLSVKRELNALDDEADRLLKERAEAEAKKEARREARTGRRRRRASVGG